MILKTDADIAQGMILQRDTENPLTGTTEPGAEVKVRLLKNGAEVLTASAAADDKGRFCVMLPPVSGGLEAYEIEFTGTGVTLKDVLFGDVFNITGQSNMELPLCRIYDPFDPGKPFSGEVRTPDCPYIREFRTEIVCCFDPDTEFDHWDSGSWFSADSPQAAGMSAAGYFFAKELFDRYGIPIGLVNTSAGGAPIEGFMSAGMLRKLGGYDEFLDTVTVPGWMQKTNDEAAERCEKYYAALEAGDSIGSRVIAGDCPEGESFDLPWRIENFCGRLWLWTEFDVPEGYDTDNAMLLLGTLTDSDKAYINGTSVGETGYMYPPRYYSIGSGILRTGRNRLAVKLDVFGGQGGFTPGKRWCVKCGSRFIDLTKNWHYAKSYTCGKLDPPPFFQGMFLAMNADTAPVYRKKFKGLVIYQGESNCGNPGRYRELLEEYIKMVRRRFGYEIPVIITQLPEFGMNDDSWAVLRQAQLDCTELPQTAMAVTLGLGEDNDLHPINKWEVGRRLGICAERLIYEKKNYKPVRCTSAEYEDGKLILRFSEPVKLSGEGAKFETVCAGEIHTAHPSEHEGGLILPCPDKPQQVRYAWSSSPEMPVLFDSEGLPVSPFITDVN